MANYPEYQPSLLDEGKYVFEIIEENTIRRSGKSVWITAIFRVMDLAGEVVRSKFYNNFFPNRPEYRDFLFALGAKADEKGVPHAKELDTSTSLGVSFEAEIVHEADNKDPTKIRDNIVNIEHGANEASEGKVDDKEEIPF